MNIENKVDDFVLLQKGGEGVVRAFVEILLKDRGLWNNALNNLFPVREL
ncbi:hypothetical protein [Treponema endosymbiont of Eucomonympha sp.]|nr:hypothetical protein [Treponema endosymbiont of Eucomonympha sp.]